MDRNLALEVVRVTELAAIAAARLMGRGEKNLSDQAAVDAMRRAFDTLQIQGTVVIGEGERDEAPMLYIGEKVGRWAPEDPGIDIALDPLEGTNLCAYGRPGAIAVVALAERGKLLNAPDTYMEKLAVGPAARGAIDLRKSTTENLRSIAARARPRHERPHGGDPGPAAPRDAHPRGALRGRAHPADRGRRRCRRGRHLLPRHRAWTC